MRIALGISGLVIVYAAMAVLALDFIWFGANEFINPLTGYALLVFILGFFLAWLAGGSLPIWRKNRG